MTPHDYCIDTFELLRAINLPSTEKPRENIGEIPKLKHAERSVLNNLVLRRNNTSFQCNPSTKRIAIDLETTRSHVISSIKGLKEKGLLRVTKRLIDGTNEKISSQYWIMVDINKIHMAFKDEEASDYILSHHGEFYELYHHEFNVKPLF